MAHIDCVVDTLPMARSINSVTHHINGTTAAVVGMKAAVIDAETRAAEHVCANVNRGFYTLIRSQISQKKAKLQSEVDSLLMQLNQQRKQLSAIRSRMERDYNLLSSRYFKLFNTINRNLRQRVYELDRPVVDFATKDMDKVTNRTSQLTAVVPLSQNESVRQSQNILASNVKYHGMKAVHSATSFLKDSRDLNDITSRILLRHRVQAAEQQLLFPAVICESRIDALDSRATGIYVSSEAMSQRARETVRNAVQAAASQAEWQQAETDPRLAGEFGRLVDESDMSPRVRSLAMKLFSDSDILTIKNFKS
ncbi:MAG: hypothetical protein K2I52_06210 [Muribaculaceae bacterium]|nr:hypothetical protein [Muribaculaceae bacterium]